jgi:predicted ATPase
LSLAKENSSLPRYLVLIGELAASLGGAGEAVLGLETVDSAIERCEANEERWYLAELLRIRGELVLQIGKANAVTSAEQHFLRAIDIADRQGALSWVLRSAISLARLRRDHGRTVEAREHLSAVLGRFSEGLGTGDPLSAKQLLTELT